MPRLFRLLLIVCVLTCGVHLAEPAQALVEATHHALEAGSGQTGGESDDTHQGSAEHAIHHHCPAAPGHAASAMRCAAGSGETTHFAAPVAALASLTRAPLLEPPAA